MDKVDQLISNALDPKCLMRVEMIHGLAWHMDGRAVEPLIGILQNENENFFVRRACIEALGRLNDERAVPALLSVAEQKDALGVEHNGIRGITSEEIRKEAVKALGQFHNNGELGKTGCENAVGALVWLVESGNGVMSTAADVLGQVPSARWYLQQALERVSRNGNDQQVRFELTRALCLQQGFPIIGIIDNGRVITRTGAKRAFVRV